MKGQLFLLPNLLSSEVSHDLFLPSSVDEAVRSIEGLVAESEKEGRAYLKRFGVPYRELPIKCLNKHHRDIEELLGPMRKGETWGLISDKGLPILADPGYQLVARARDCHVEVKAFIGPSALVLALMLSGLPSQQFSFHGYLPHRPEARVRVLEMRSQKEHVTHLFIEAPFRNERLLSALLKTLSETTRMCVAWDLTLPSQGVETHSIARWRKRTLPSLKGKPAVFLFHSQ